MSDTIKVKYIDGEGVEREAVAQPSSANCFTTSAPMYPVNEPLSEAEQSRRNYNWWLRTGVMPDDSGYVAALERAYMEKVNKLEVAEKNTRYRRKWRKITERVLFCSLAAHVVTLVVVWRDEIAGWLK